MAGSAVFSKGAAAATPLEPGRLSALLLRHGTMTLRWYAPQGADPQTPHTQDEVYVVASGSGWFRHGDRRDGFGPGDALFVAGQYDEARPATVARFAEGVPQAELAIIPGAGHALFADRPDETLAVLRAFFARHDPGM